MKLSTIAFISVLTFNTCLQAQEFNCTPFTKQASQAFVGAAIFLTGLHLASKGLNQTFGKNDTRTQNVNASAVQNKTLFFNLCRKTLERFSGLFLSTFGIIFASTGGLFLFNGHDVYDIVQQHSRQFMHKKIDISL